jgi:predicted enzyme related to lactoylglutathione lyase
MKFCCGGSDVMPVSNNQSMMIVIFVKNQEKSRDFYMEVLGMEPFMDVPGVTEFKLDDNMLLGIMPSEGVKNMMDIKTINHWEAGETPKCQIYLPVDEPDEYYNRAIKAGGIGIIEGKSTPWGGYICYCMDLDGNLLAFAR